MQFGLASLQQMWRTAEKLFHCSQFQLSYLLRYCVELVLTTLYFISFCTNNSWFVFETVIAWKPKPLKNSNWILDIRLTLVIETDFSSKLNRYIRQISDVSYMGRIWLKEFQSDFTAVTICRILTIEDIGKYNFA